MEQSLNPHPATIHIHNFDSRRKTNYVSGPSRTDLERVTGRRVSPVAVLENNKPGQEIRNGQLRIYRPEVINKSNEKKPAPMRVAKLEDVKRSPDRNVTNQPGNINPPKSGTNYVQRQNSTPMNNTKPVVQQNSVNPPKNNSSIKTVQPQNAATPVNNSRHEVPQNNVNPPKNNSNVKTAQPQNAVTPVNNSRHEVQQKTVTPQKNNSNNPAQQKAVNPTQNNKNEKQKVIVKPPENKQVVPPKKTNGEEVKKEKN